MRWGEGEVHFGAWRFAGLEGAQTVLQEPYRCARGKGTLVGMTGGAGVAVGWGWGHADGRRGGVPVCGKGEQPVFGLLLFCEKKWHAVVKRWAGGRCRCRTGGLLHVHVEFPAVGKYASRTAPHPRMQYCNTAPMCSKDMTLKEAEVLALSTLKQVMEEKVRLCSLPDLYLCFFA